MWWRIQLLTANRYSRQPPGRRRRCVIRAEEDDGGEAVLSILMIFKPHHHQVRRLERKLISQGSWRSSGIGSGENCFWSFNEKNLSLKENDNSILHVFAKVWLTNQIQSKENKFPFPLYSPIEMEINYHPTSVFICFLSCLHVGSFGVGMLQLILHKGAIGAMRSVWVRRWDCTTKEVFV